MPNKSVLWALKALLLGVVIRAREDYRQDLHPYVFTALSLCHLYLALEIGFALSVALPQALFGFELEPHFNEPYLATSLQDFWGRRWNLVITNTLRPLVYHPIGRISTGKGGATFGATVNARPPRAPILPVIAAFVISGLMHELFFYYVTRARPTGEMICFFVLQGVCLAIELVVKKAAADHKVRFHPLVSGPLTMVFLIVTTNWLFFPHVIRAGADAKSLEECASMVDFVKANISLIIVLLAQKLANQLLNLLFIFMNFLCCCFYFINRVHTNVRYIRTLKTKIELHDSLRANTVGHDLLSIKL